jgi:hypothetical protein
MAEPPPILDLDTLITRPVVVIDGESYEIAAPDELSILDHHRLGHWGRRIDKLMEKPEINELEQAELTRLLTRLTDHILVGVPEPVRAKLSDGHRLSIAEVFTRLPLQRAIAKAARTLAAEGKTEGKNSTGAKRPPASRDSTDATRGGGSGKPPLRSSAPASP